MSAFKDYVTSTAFALTISRRQIEAISMLNQYGETWLLLTTIDALMRKGLVERVKDEQQDCGQYVRLSEAGRAVVPLLKLAGLLITYPTFDPGPPLPPINVIVTRKPVPHGNE
jgi:hypothetical protein